MATQTVLVTGGTGGLGPTVVKRLLHDGYRCVVVYRTDDKWQQLQQEVQHELLHGVEADLREEDSVAAAVAQARALDNGLYGLVHLAGGFEGGTLEEGNAEGIPAGEGGGESDALYDQAVAVVLKNRKASISLVQRHLRIGYNRAARLIEQMEQSGLVSAMQTNGNRDILVPATQPE